MYPRTDHVLKSLFWTFEEYIAPEVTSDYARSLVLTMNNLFRHVLLRVDLEGDLLFADNRELRALLAEVATFMAEHDAAGDVHAGILESLQHNYYGDDVYPSVARLVEEANSLRFQLSEAISTLQALRSTLGDRKDYQATRKVIRAYLGRQLDREGQMIEPAFTGQRR